MNAPLSQVSGLCLTDDQIDDQLIGDLAAGPAAHLAGCALCQARVVAADAPMASFREVSLAWAERRSATLPTRPAPQPQSSPRLGWTAAAATALLAVGIAIPVVRGHRTAEVASASQADTNTVAAVSHAAISPVTPVAATPEHIRSDNRMLEAIQRELDAPADGPEEYGLVGTSMRGRDRTRVMRN